jgi:tetratricopeptide (TPR) repeat protein
VATIRTQFSQAPLPTADPQRFAVALAHLEYDQDQQYERLIREVLRDFDGVQLLQFDRTISLVGTQPEEREQQGHTQARQWLKDSGVHVLIWGLVLRQDGKSAPRLYWTTLQAHKRAKEAYQPENFKLPDLFWNDLAEVLRLVVATQNSKFLAQEGRFIADQLTPFMTRVRRLLDKNAGRQGWSDIQFVLGNALLTFGEQTGTNKPLEEAVAAYRDALKERTRERVPLDWAMTQNNLGNALWTLGERESGTARLEEAVTAYRDALKEYTRERVPLQWARTQNNLGAALQTLGQRESGTARLDEAVAAYRDALKERTRERVPLQWATAQSNLGNALSILGERKKDATLICEALAKQLIAWEVFVMGSPYHASRVVDDAKSTIAALKNAFDSSIYEACLARQEEILKRIGLL